MPDFSFLISWFCWRIYVIWFLCRLPSTPLGQVLGVKPVYLQKAAGPAEVQSAVNGCSEAQIPVVDSDGTQRALNIPTWISLYLLRSLGAPSVWITYTKS